MILPTTPKNPAIDLGRSVFLERIRRRLSQEKLAEDAGVSRATICRIERGDDVSLRVLIRVAARLGLRLEARP